MRLTRMLMPLRLIILAVELVLLLPGRNALSHVLPTQVGMFSGHVFIENTYSGSILLPTFWLLLGLAIASWGVQLVAVSPRMNPFRYADLWERVLLLVSVYISLASLGFTAFAFGLDSLGAWLIRILTVLAVILALLLVWAERAKRR